MELYNSIIGVAKIGYFKLGEVNQLFSSILFNPDIYCNTSFGVKVYTNTFFKGGS